MWHPGLVVPQHVKSSWMMDQTCVPCIGRRSLSPLDNQGSSCVCVNKPSVGGFSGPLSPRDHDCPPGLKCPGHVRRPPWAVNRLALSQHRLQSPGGKPGPVFHGERLMDVREDDMAWARVQMYSNSRAFQRRLPISLHSVPAVTETAGQFFFFLLTELPVFHLETARGESLSPVSEQRAQAESRVG